MGSMVIFQMDLNGGEAWDHGYVVSAGFRVIIEVAASDVSS